MHIKFKFILIMILPVLSCFAGCVGTADANNGLTMINNIINPDPSINKNGQAVNPVTFRFQNSPTILLYPTAFIRLTFRTGSTCNGGSYGTRQVGSAGSPFTWAQSPTQYSYQIPTGAQCLYQFCVLAHGSACNFTGSIQFRFRNAANQDQTDSPRSNTCYTNVVCSSTGANAQQCITSAAVPFVFNNVVFDK
jgi:hypothetical protein